MRSASTKGLGYYLDKLRRTPSWALQGVLYRLGLNIVPFYLYEEGLQVGPPSGYETLPDGINIRTLNADDMKAIAGMPDRDVLESVMHKRLADGNQCLGAYQKSRLVAFTWYNLDQCTYVGHRFALKSNEAYLFDAYTHPSSRGSGLAPVIRYHTYKALADRGRTRLYSMSERLNKPAVRFKQKLNARIIASGTYVELFKRWGRTYGFRKRLP